MPDGLASLWVYRGKCDPEGTIKLAITLGEAPRMVTIVINFLVVNYPSAFKGILGRPLLMTLKVVTSIYCLMMKFLTTTGMGQVQGRQ